MPRKVSHPPGIERDWEKRCKQLREQATRMSPGEIRDRLIDQAEKLEAACRMRDWLRPQEGRFASQR